MLTLVCSSSMCLSQNDGHPREVVPTLQRDPLGSSVRASCSTCGMFLAFVSQGEIKAARNSLGCGYSADASASYPPGHFSGHSHKRVKPTYDDLPASVKAETETRVRALRKRRELGIDIGNIPAPFDAVAEAKKSFAGIAAMPKSDRPSIADSPFNREEAIRKHELDIFASAKATRPLPVTK